MNKPTCARPLSAPSCQAFGHKLRDPQHHYSLQSCTCHQHVSATPSDSTWLDVYQSMCFHPTFTTLKELSSNTWHCAPDPERLTQLTNCGRLAGGGHMARPYMPPEHMWPHSEGMHMAGPRPNGPMGMHNMPMSGAYMMPGVMPGMMPGMQMMGTGMHSLSLHCCCYLASVLAFCGA